PDVVGDRKTTSQTAAKDYQAVGCRVVSRHFGMSRSWRAARRSELNPGRRPAQSISMVQYKNAVVVAVSRASAKNNKVALSIPHDRCSAGCDGRGSGRSELAPALRGHRKRRGRSTGAATHQA